MNFYPYFQTNENGETSENAADSNAMEDNSNSSTNSHFDENKPPSDDPNALPPTKDPMFASPLKSGLPPRIPSLVQENNSTNDGMDIRIPKPDIRIPPDISILPTQPLKMEELYPPHSELKFKSIQNVMTRMTCHCHDK